jgi:hypothetical protein
MRRRAPAGRHPPRMSAMSRASAFRTDPGDGDAHMRIEAGAGGSVSSVGARKPARQSGQRHQRPTYRDGTVSTWRHSGQTAVTMSPLDGSAAPARSLEG